MNIGTASGITGLATKTIRYYDSIGLVVAERKRNGYRHYGPQHIHQLRLVGRARSLGFTVDDCRSLLSLCDGERRSSDEVRAVVEARLREIERKIAELQGLATLLSRLMDACADDRRPDTALLDQLTRPGGQDPSDGSATCPSRLVRFRFGA